MDKIQVTFIHPTESGKSIVAAVPPNSTAKTLINEMIRADFLAAPAGESDQYRLRNANTNQQLLDDTTLMQAGVTGGATVIVDHTMTGAQEA
jgi:hypothetical protein